MDYSLDYLRDLNADDYAYQVPNPNESLYCAEGMRSIGFTFLMGLVLRTRQRPYLHKYLSAYLKMNKDKLEQKNDQGWTALMLACVNVNTLSTLDTVKLLLCDGANPNVQMGNKPDGWNIVTAMCLHTRETEDSCATLALLVKHGFKVNCIDWNDPPIAAAARQNKTEFMKLLIRSGCNLNIVFDWFGSNMTPLMYIIGINSHFSLNVAKLLIDSGCDVAYANKDSKTALWFACKKLNAEMVALLYSRGCRLPRLQFEELQTENQNYPYGRMVLRELVYCVI